MSEYRVLQGDCIEQMKTLKDSSVHCCVTSPPYFGLRDYGHDQQIGLESTPDLFVSKLVEVFREVRRVLRGDGTVWLNLGDSYAAARGGTHMPAQTLAGGVSGNGDERSFNGMGGTGRGGAHRNASAIGLKHKDLIGIPWMVAFALRADGWYLRQDIIWSKPNPMPESVTDRCTKSHEYLFMLTKSARYWYDAGAIKEQGKNPGDDIRCMASQSENAKSAPTKKHNGLRPDKQRGHGRKHAGFNARWDAMTKEEQGAMGRNKRSVWSVATKPYTGAHFATFPPKLIQPCILAGCPVGGVVLDPFGGSGTTAEVALKHGREAILCELNPSYVKLIHKRMSGLQMRMQL